MPIQVCDRPPVPPDSNGNIFTIRATLWASSQRGSPANEEVNEGATDTSRSVSRKGFPTQGLPKYLSTYNDPLYRLHQLQDNLRLLEVMEIKTVPYVPLSHPFVERLVGTLRRECLDRTLLWTTTELEAKLREYQKYFNEHRAHAG
jgi:hypothetical protein